MELTVHHLGVSQSERVVWVCEELSIPYKLEHYRRSPLFAPPKYKALHPQGTAPTIQDGNLTLAESGACIEYICHRHGDGRLFPKPTDPAYPDFLYWWHWGNGTLVPKIARGAMFRRAGAGEDDPMRKYTEDAINNSLRMMDERLAMVEWLAGNEFTAADIMVVFPLTTFRHFAPYSLAEYPNILEYLKRVGEREAYKKALAKSDPGLELVLGADPPKKPVLVMN